MAKGKASRIVLRSESVVLEERQTVRVTGGTSDSESDSTRVRRSSDVVSLIERQGSDVLNSFLFYVLVLFFHSGFHCVHLHVSCELRLPCSPAGCCHRDFVFPYLLPSFLLFGYGTF